VYVLAFMLLLLPVDFDLNPLPHQHHNPPHCHTFAVNWLMCLSPLLFARSRHAAVSSTTQTLPYHTGTCKAP
jgi:hypothetical protein